MEGAPPVDPDVPTQPVPMEFCLVLKPRFRELLRHERLRQKRAKNSKLTKKDHEEIEQECQLFTFNPEKFIENHFVEKCLPKDILENDDAPPPAAEEGMVEEKAKEEA
jgi:hypothetical protein